MTMNDNDNDNGMFLLRHKHYKDYALMHNYTVLIRKTDS